MDRSHQSTSSRSPSLVCLPLPLLPLPSPSSWAARATRHSDQSPMSSGSNPSTTQCHDSPADEHPHLCLLYTSDAADEEDSVDLGGRRIIKKKKKNMIKH
eukprot:TRINITY_DN10568_c0_g1_i7.p2 TRINITY_DN10568_c0_g1~~TRINITY_DN10568_c0_g1_i7.p2  ORF type:complete len:100 (-),score=16.35 TRINITY_DN10568_c0_g1_i7:108-407(-)